MCLIIKEIKKWFWYSLDDWMLNSLSNFRHRHYPHASLPSHLLYPSPASLPLQVGQLAEMLVLLDHQPDAALLQQRLALLVQEQAAAAAEVLAHPPPTLALALPRPQLLALQAAAGPAAAAAVSASLAALPGPELQQRVTAAQAAVREAHWKWAVLRAEEKAGPAAADSSGAGSSAPATGS